MALFQTSVLNQYLKGLDQTAIHVAFEKYTAYFLNSDIQENIRNAKEEQFQATFLNELFVNILGYTLNPNPNFNLTTEFKNIKNSKKADGAILKDNKAVAVIELKGTETTDLDKIESQAFGYKNNQPTAVYVITSNFEKLRFYIDDAVDYLDFNLFNLDQQQFKLLYLCLHKDHIYSHLPKKIKSDSTLQEENITKKLYQDYSTFKKALFNDLVEHNPDHSKLALFKKSQKLLDRFLFIFFAEDKGLLPPNSVSQIVENYHQLMKLDFYQSLYDVFRQYFSYIDKGRPAKGNKAEIFNFNGGLFEADELLDNLTISDDVLLKHTLVLSKYDFASEVDVNILGHIFEHSLNEIDEMAAEIEGQTIDKSTTKRKKDGVFYTPKYITKYIIENTVGKLCEEKKNEWGIIEEEYAKDRKGRKKATLISLKDKLEQYRHWLLALTICDPACGSGAFLNQALDFLIEEHHYIDELQTKLLGGGFVFPNVENSILENNLYGVDINEESVEIAKLSLWLRTVKKGRQLTSLNHNIKCGNSLIDDVEVAGDKAFKWEEEFPKVFIPKDKQAFHVVLTTHHSRTSQRMIKLGIEKGDGIWLSSEEEILLTGFIRDVVKESGYHCLAYNICGDHVHLILVCELSELSKQVQKIKSISSKRFNIAIGKTIPQVIPPRGHDPLSSDHTHLLDKSIPTFPPRGHDPLSSDHTHLPDKKMSDTSTTRGHDPLEGKISEVERPSKKGKTQNHFWSQKFFRADLDVWEWGHTSTRPGEVYQSTHLGNALSYIETNREKHQLPNSPELKAIIEQMTCSQEEAFALEYKGGFDVVVGNPPYVRQELISPFKPYLEKNYQTYQGTADLFTYFIEISIDRLLNQNGLYSIIVANKWMRANYGKPLRQWMKKKQIIEIIDFGDLDVFKDVAAYPCILTLSLKTPNSNFWVTEPKTLNFADLELYVKDNQFSVKTDSLEENGWALVKEEISNFLDKLKNKGVPLKEYVGDKILRGILTGLNEAFVIDEITKNRLISEDEKSAEIIKPFLAGRDVKRYAIHFQNTYLILIPSGWTNKNREEKDAWEFFNTRFPAVASYLLQFKEKAKKRYDKGDYWWELRSCAYYNEFENPKITIPDISIRSNAAYDYTGEYYLVNTAYILPTNDRSLTCKINSKLLNFFYAGISPSIRGGYLRFIHQYLSILPIKNDDFIDKELAILNDNIHNLSKEQFDKINRFLRRLHTTFNLQKPTKKIESFYDHNFKTLVSELNKQKITLSLVQQDEWEEYFDAYKTEINQLQAEIDKTDKEIDKMVYELYGLTEEEMEIVENG